MRNNHESLVVRFSLWHYSFGDDVGESDIPIEILYSYLIYSKDNNFISSGIFEYYPNCCCSFFTWFSSCTFFLFLRFLLLMTINLKVILEILKLLFC